MKMIYYSTDTLLNAVFRPIAEGYIETFGIVKFYPTFRHGSATGYLSSINKSNLLSGTVFVTDNLFRQSSVHHVYKNLTHCPLVDFNIIYGSVLQQLARQAPAAQYAARGCLAGYNS